MRCCCSWASACCSVDWRVWRRSYGVALQNDDTLFPEDRGSRSICRLFIQVDCRPRGQVGQESHRRLELLEGSALRPRPSCTIPLCSMFSRFHVDTVPDSPDSCNRIAANFAATSPRYTHVAPMRTAGIMRRHIAAMTPLHWRVGGANINTK